MKFIVDYNRIFFDKYPLTDEEKRNNAHYILDKILCETVGEENFSIEDAFIIVNDCNFSKMMQFINCIKLLKDEFFILATEYKVENKPEAPKRDSIEDFIYKNYQYDYLTAPYLYEKLELNRNKAERQFMKKHNMSISEFIRRVRVKKACEMLKMGFNNEKTAELSGLGSVKTLQRSFKSILGKTPSEYKQEIT